MFLNAMRMCAEHIFPSDELRSSAFWTDFAAFATSQGFSIQDFAVWFTDALFSTAHFAQFAVFTFALELQDVFTTADFWRAMDNAGFPYGIKGFPDPLCAIIWHILQIEFNNVELYYVTDDFASKSPAPYAPPCGVKDVCWIASPYCPFEARGFPFPFDTVTTLTEHLMTCTLHGSAKPLVLAYESVKPVAAVVVKYRDVRDRALHKDKMASSRTPQTDADLRQAAVRLAAVVKSELLSPAPTQHVQAPPSGPALASAHAPADPVARSI